MFIYCTCVLSPYMYVPVIYECTCITCTCHVCCHNDLACGSSWCRVPMPHCPLTASASNPPSPLPSCDSHPVLHSEVSSPGGGSSPNLIRVHLPHAQRTMVTMHSHVYLFMYMYSCISISFLFAQLNQKYTRPSSWLLYWFW